MNESDSFTSRQFRDCLGLFATGIAIATTSVDGERVGITINSFASVSLEPPLILFSASRALKSFSTFERCRGFAVNILGKDQRELSGRFAKAGADKWTGVDTAEGAHGGVIIRASLASFDCVLHRLYDGGDHAILVGRVTACHSQLADEPLIYFRSNYHEIARPQAMAAAAA